MRLQYSMVLILIPIIIGFIIGSLFKPTDEWRERIKNKDIIPPPYVFSIVWSILYLIIGFILYRISGNRRVLLLLVINLLFNYAFTPIQFGLMDLQLSAIIVFFTLITAVYLSIELFKNRYYLEFYLSLPYVIWLVFAFILSMLSIV